MARRVDQLSAILVKSLSSPGYYGDGNGLYLQISASGSKSWIFRFSNSGKRREMGLGPLHAISLGMAREKALACRRLLAAGKDPIMDRDSVKTWEALSLVRRVSRAPSRRALRWRHRIPWPPTWHPAF